MSALTDLQGAVNANTLLTQQAADAINALRAQVADLQKQIDDSETLAALASQVTADDAALSAAVTG